MGFERKIITGTKAEERFGKNVQRIEGKIQKFHF